MAGWSTLVQPETLAIASARKDLVVVDCRHELGDPEAGRRQYMLGHVPRAVFAHLDKDLSAAEAQPGSAGRHPWPGAAEFTATLGRWGVTPAHQVVAYDQGDGAWAARLWFLLRALGHEKVGVLDGGWKRWTSLGLPVETMMQPRERDHYPPMEFDWRRLLDADGVQRALDEGELLLDARAERRFRGEEEPIDRLAGHVPGALNRPFSENLEGGRFKSPMRLAEEFRELLAGRDPAQAVMMCGSGVTACHHLLAMERAGLTGARLYTGSWSGWIAQPRPVASGEA